LLLEYYQFLAQLVGLFI